MAPRNRRGERTGRMGGGTKVGLPGSSRGKRPKVGVTQPGFTPKRPPKIKRPTTPKRPTKPTGPGFGDYGPGGKFGPIKTIKRPLKGLKRKKLTGTKRPVAGRPSR